MVGIEPDDSGVAHQRVTSTLHLLGGLSRDLGCGSTSASGDAVDVPCVGRVGIEPTFRRGKNPLQSQRLLPTRSPSPRSRTWTSRVSAKCADQLRQGRRLPRATRRWERRSRAALFHQVPCQAPHHHHSSVVRDRHAPGGRSCGVMRSRAPRGARIASSRSELLIQIWSTQMQIVLTIMRRRRMSRSDSSGTGAAQRSVRWRASRRSSGGWSGREAGSRKHEGPPGFPGWPSRSHRSHGAGTSGGSLPWSSYLRYQAAC